ncbi:MAG TPA: hypothetical protein VFP84_13005 [Kofleriaceae bacterium]|nr:hypothetical protein [Kofleriaceae bacterium]
MVLPLVVIAAIAIVWWLRRGSPPEPAVQTTGSSVPVAAASDPAATAKAAQRARDRVKRDALRAQIVQQLAAHPPPSAAAGDSPPASSPSSPESPASAAAGSGMQNKIDPGHQALVDHLNHDFLPLASECIDQARQRTPGLTGTLGLRIETLSDDSHGGIIDDAALAPSNNVIDAELFECVRESAYSLSIPSPLLNGREQFELTLRVGPDDAGRP